MRNSNLENVLLRNDVERKVEDERFFENRGRHVRTNRVNIKGCRYFDSLYSERENYVQSFDKNLVVSI